MDKIYPIAKLGYHILVINKDDLFLIGKKRALDVKCIKINLKSKVIDPIIELEKHLKFNPWEEISDEERMTMLQELSSNFSDEEISKKVIRPLM